MSISSNGANLAVPETRVERKSYARTPTIRDLPRLTEVQLHSFEWFKTDGLT